MAALVERQDNEIFNSSYRMNIMNKTEVLKRLSVICLIPVVPADAPEQALRAMNAIKAGGVDIVEVTMTVPGAVELIRQFAGSFGDEVLIGAGTVLTPQAANDCINAGA